VIWGLRVALGKLCCSARIAAHERLLLACGAFLLQLRFWHTYMCRTAQLD